MKYFKSILLFVFLAIGILASCERDDICAESTPTTPRLLIDFIDVSNRENMKNVVNLRVTGIGIDNMLPLDGLDGATRAVDNIQLPLRTDSTSTQFILHENFAVNNNNTPDDTTDDFIEGNPDVITVNYETELVFVSKACGFKTVFNNVTITLEEDQDNWIITRESINANQSVADENETHFNILH